MASVISNSSCSTGGGFCFKKGDTLIIDCVKKDANGVVEDITGWDIVCKGKTEDAGALVFNTSTGSGSITLTDPANGVFTIKVDDTSAFPVGSVLSDVQYTISGNSFSTQTFIISVIKGVSQ